MIESVSNLLIKEINKLKNRKERDLTGKFIVEGFNFIRDIPENWDIDCLIFSESFSKKEECKTLLTKAQIHIVSEKVFKNISDTINPQGILALCYKKEWFFDEYIDKESSSFLVCENINDPGNLGVIIRTATAAGCTAVILSKGCVDIYNPKTIRSTAGALFNIPLIEGCELEEMLLKMKSNNIKIIATHLSGEVFPYDVDLKNSFAILVGNEANGLSEEITKMADHIVKIPMIGNVESLNASVASSILLYEGVRQRIK